MISVAVCNGVRMYSQIDDTTSPKAKPDRPATSAPANVATRKTGSSSDPFMCSLQKKGEQRLNGIAISRGGCDVPGLRLRRQNSPLQGLSLTFLGLLVARGG